MQSHRGAALILALLLLSFLTILGGALLSTTTIDIRISDNYRTNTEARYVAEAGIEHARELMRTAPSLPAPSATPFIFETPLMDASGRTAGRYEVWLQSGLTSEILKVVSVGKVGNSSRTIETTVKKSGFPILSEALVQDDTKSAKWLESLVAGITENADDVYESSQAFGNYGTPGNYKVTVVKGDAVLGPGYGYGLVLALGNVTAERDSTWNGLIVILGQGVFRSDGGVVNGGVYMTRTDADVDISNIRYDRDAVLAANRSFPYSPVAIRER